MSPARRRPHPAASARIVAAGVSATTAFGLVAAMGLAGQPAAPAQPVASNEPAAPVAGGAAAAAPVAPVVIRRYWLVSPSGAVTPLADAPSAPTAATGTGTVALRASPPPAARAVPAAPAARPVTRSRGS